MQVGEHLGDVGVEVVALSGESLDVAAGAEHLAGAGDEDGADVGIDVAAEGGVRELGGELGGHGVGGVGAVEGDGGDVVADVEEQVRILHVRAPPGTECAYLGPPPKATSPILPG